MKYLSLTIPGFGKIDSNVPQVPTGGLDSSGGSTIRTFVVLLVVIAIFMSLWFILKAGWDLITSRGVKEKFTRGREELFYAILGLFMVFLGFLLLNILGLATGYNFSCILFSFSSCR